MFLLREYAAQNYNARPEYTDYITYEEYLLKLRKIIQNVHRVLAEGRFFVINISPVLVRRANRSEASKRIAVPFDIHRIFIEEEYDMTCSRQFFVACKLLTLPRKISPPVSADDTAT